MKSIYTLIVSALVLSITLFSCSMEKRLYNKGYSVEWNRGLKGDSKNNDVLSTEISKEESDLATVEPNLVVETEPALTIETKEETPCDSIKLKNGEVKLGVVKEIGAYGITYGSCDDPKSLNIVERSSVESIRYSNGKEELVSAIVQPKQKVEEKRQVEGFGILGFILSILGFFIAGIPLGIGAIVFGIVSIGRIASYPSKFKGAAFGIIALILGLIVLIATIALVV